MFEISFEINGRKVNPHNIEDAIEAAVLSQVQESIKESVGSVRCQEHGQAPRIKVTGHSHDNLAFEVSCCCDAFKEEVERKI